MLGLERSEHPVIHSGQCPQELHERTHAPAICIQGISEDAGGNFPATEGPACGDHHDCREEAPDMGQKFAS